MHHADSFLDVWYTLCFFNDCFQAVWLPVLNPEGKSRRSTIPVEAVPPVKSHLTSKDYFKKQAVVINCLAFHIGYSSSGPGILNKEKSGPVIVDVSKAPAAARAVVPGMMVSIKSVRAYQMLLRVQTIIL